MKNFKVYYINLERSKDRKIFIEEQFKKIGIPITRISAINGKELNPEILKQAKKDRNIFAHFKYPSSGEVGCFLSHLNSWDIISKQKEDFAILFEDDALISKELFIDLQNILEYITINDFIDITGMKGFMEIEDKGLINKFIVPSLGSTAQIIGKNAGKKLYQYHTKYFSPIDVSIQDIHKHKISIYSTKKKYAHHNDYNINGSTIGRTNIFILKKIIRELLRPFWQLAFLIFKTKRAISNFLFYKFTSKYQIILKKRIKINKNK